MSQISVELSNLLIGMADADFPTTFPTAEMSAGQDPIKIFSRLQNVMLQSEVDKLDLQALSARAFSWDSLERHWALARHVEDALTSLVRSDKQYQDKRKTERDESTYGLSSLKYAKKQLGDADWSLVTTLHRDCGRLKNAVREASMSNKAWRGEASTIGKSFAGLIESFGLSVKGGESLSVRQYTKLGRRFAESLYMADVGSLNIIRKKHSLIGGLAHQMETSSKRHQRCGFYEEDLQEVLAYMIGRSFGSNEWGSISAAMHSLKKARKLISTRWEVFKAKAGNLRESLED